MSRRGPAVGIVAIVILVIGSGLASAQNKQPQTPEEKSRKVKREDNRAFRDWPKKDVKLIITAEEENASNKHNTDD